MTLPNKEKMGLKIIQVISNYRWTGAADPAVNLSAELQKSGHQVLFVCGKGGSLECKARAHGLTLNTKVDLGKSGNPWRMAADFLKLRKIRTC